MNKDSLKVAYIKQRKKNAEKPDLRSYKYECSAGHIRIEKNKLTEEALKCPACESEGKIHLFKYVGRYPLQRSPVTSFTRKKVKNNQKRKVRKIKYRYLCDSHNRHVFLFEAKANADAMCELCKKKYDLNVKLIEAPLRNKQMNLKKEKDNEPFILRDNQRIGK